MNGLTIRSAALTSVGRRRAHNEDTTWTDDASATYVVADGMGGLALGDKASNLAASLIGCGLRDIGTKFPAMPGAAIAARMQDVMEDANAAVRAMGEEAGERTGTVAVAAVIRDGVAHIAHVGDCRAYRLRRGRLRRLTGDHSVVADLIRRGEITIAFARHHPQRSLLTKALGLEGSLSAAVRTVSLHPGDTLLLCSDGLWGMLLQPAIRTLLEPLAADPSAAARELVAAANGAGGFDNIAVVVVHVVDNDSDASWEDNLVN